MIKFVQCVRRKPGMSKQDFREHWLAYRSKVQAIAEASGAIGCVLSSALAVEQNLEIMQSRGTKAPYDGLLEMWWEHGNDIVAYLDSGVGDQLIDDLRRAQEAFMDLPNSTFFFAAEEA